MVSSCYEIFCLQRSRTAFVNLPGPPPTSFPDALTFFRRWSKSLQHSSSLNKPDHEDDDGDDEQDMNDSTHRVAAHQSQKPIKPGESQKWSKACVPPSRDESSEFLTLASYEAGSPGVSPFSFRQASIPAWTAFVIRRFFSSIRPFPSTRAEVTASLICS